MDATNFVFEMEVEYWINFKMVDFVCSTPCSPEGSQRVGVSVTRAMRYPDPDLFNLQSARELLQKKLYGLVVARNAVTKKHRFFVSYLHVWCQTRKIAEFMREAYSELPASEKMDLQVLLTVYENPEIYHLDFGDPSKVFAENPSSKFS